MSAVANLIESYLKGPADLRAAVRGMTGEQLAARPVAGRMSTLEVLCHIADFEAIMADRMKRIIALGENPLFLAADENLFLAELHYQARDAEEELTLIEVTRKQMSHILRDQTRDVPEARRAFDERVAHVGESGAGGGEPHQPPPALHPRQTQGSRVEVTPARVTRRRRKWPGS